MQRNAALQIVEVFPISPTASIEVIAGLIPIHLHIQKLNSRFHLRAHSLLAKYIINSMIEAKPMNHINSYHFLLKQLICKQNSNIKGLIIDIDNSSNEIFPLFSPFNCEFSPENRLINIFPKCFSFHSLNRNCKSSIKSHLCKLKDITFQALSNLLTVVVVSDTSIKNHITTSIAHVHVHGSLVIKTIHHIVNVMSTKAKLFVIRCGINQAFHLPNTKELSLYLTLFIWLKNFLILQFIHIKFTQQLFLTSSGNSSKEVLIIPLNFEIVLAIVTGVYI